MNSVSRIAFLFTLHQGSVYLRQNRRLTSALPHFFVVVSKRNGKGRPIYFTVVTSQVEKRKRTARILGRPEESLVELPIGSHPSLTKHSLIDCNDVIPCDVEDVYQNLTARGASIPPMPENVMNKILDGIRASTLPIDMKREILPEYD